MNPAGNIKTLKIDGRDVSARQDETILEVARQNNIFIPRLCELKGLSTAGACRLCLVEIKSSPRLFPACVTRVEEGMEVTTNSERLRQYRKAILELLFTERNHICSVCVSNGHCELQTLALTVIRWFRWMHPMNALSLITTAAFSVAVVFASATRSKAPTPGM
jgi:bidirectional [NiFe] hydrogenase diaphorase subunit